MSRLEVKADPNAARSVALRRSVEAAFAGERPIAATEAPKRVIAVGRRQLVIATTGWMSGNSVEIHLLDRVDGISLNRDAKGVSMIQLHFGTRTAMVMRYGGGDLDVIADGLTQALALKDAR